jgi:hypothetical protein
LKSIAGSQPFICIISHTVNDMGAFFDGSQLNAPLVVFLVILASGFAVTISYAVYRHFHNASMDSENESGGLSRSQEEHMRRVRERNRMHAWRAAQEARGVSSRVA